MKPVVHGKTTSQTVQIVGLFFALELLENGVLPEYQTVMVPTTLLRGNPVPDRSGGGFRGAGAPG